GCVRKRYVVDARLLILRVVQDLVEYIDGMHRLFPLLPICRAQCVRPLKLLAKVFHAAECLGMHLADF
ncbi:MAG: hypothetical protein PHQ10_06810, partial [Dehalococcoidales bacterium]|nr:hypothetical protein [Dehalococcoidales bacterium]